MNSYELSRLWFDWAFENPSKITPAHGILYFFCIEHCNRLGWKKEFGLPTTMAKEAIGIRSYNTYINTLNDLVDWGFIKIIEKSKNQYSCNIIALSNFNKALNKALDKALINHGIKQRQSIDSIDKQDNKITIEQDNKYANFTSLQLREVLKNDKKDFEAIMCYWNLFAEKYSIPKIVTMSEVRKKKIKIRNKEPNFDIVKIISLSINQTFLMENPFFTFDWVIENESNYIKILEGNYKEKPKEQEQVKFIINGS